MILNVKVNVDGAIAHLKNVARQIPFIEHKAVDATSKDAQKAVQDSLSAHFILRRETFVRRTIKHLQFSRKGTPTAIIGVDPQKDFLAKFEAGGAKIARSGRLAVPIEARKGKASIVPPALRPGGLGAKAFKIKGRSGKELLVTRVGKAAGTKRKKAGVVASHHDPRLKVMHVLQPSVPIRPQLHFVETARRVATQRFPINARAAMERAFRTARP
jgi:hypothetical protein